MNEHQNANEYRAHQNKVTLNHTLFPYNAIVSHVFKSFHLPSEALAFSYGAMMVVVYYGNVSRDYTVFHAFKNNLVSLPCEERSLSVHLFSVPLQLVLLVSFCLAFCNLAICS